MRVWVLRAAAARVPAQQPALPALRQGAALQRAHLGRRVRPVVRVRVAGARHRVAAARLLARQVAAMRTLPRWRRSLQRGADLRQACLLPSLQTCCTGSVGFTLRRFRSKESRRTPGPLLVGIGRDAGAQPDRQPAPAWLPVFPRNRSSVVARRGAGGAGRATGPDTPLPGGAYVENVKNDDAGFLALSRSGLELGQCLLPIPHS